MTRAYGNNDRRPRQKFVFGILQQIWRKGKRRRSGVGRGGRVSREQELEVVAAVEDKGKAE